MPLTQAQEGVIDGNPGGIAPPLVPARPHMWITVAAQKWFSFYACVIAPAGQGGIQVSGLEPTTVESMFNWLADQHTVVCHYCGGVGHEYRECMSLIKANRMAASIGMKSYWGSIKGIAYYRVHVLGNLNPQNIAEIAIQAKAAAKKAAKNSRKRKRKSD